jgi:ribosomal protein S18 acetylase RimI-like enzyme
VTGPVRLRHATYADLAAVAALDPAFTPGSERQRLVTEAVTTGPTVCHVAESGAATTEVVGYVVLRPRHFFDRDFVETLVVAESARRRGVGTRLLGHAVQGARTQQVFVSTNTSNGPMRALLDREGWTLSGTLEGIDEGDPELVYHRWRRAPRPPQPAP